jgi:hypothetical protein
MASCATLLACVHNAACTLWYLLQVRLNGHLADAALLKSVCGYVMQVCDPTLEYSTFVECNDGMAYLLR